MAIPDDPFAPGFSRLPISPTPNPTSSRPKIFHIGASPPSPILAPTNRTPPNMPRLETAIPTLQVTDTNAFAGPSGTSNSASGISLSALNNGGTGTKTPRRVQWTNQSHVVSISPPRSPVDTLDDQNFEQVKMALERHSTQRRAARMALRREEELAPDEEEDITAVGDDHEEDYDYRLDVGSGGEGQPGGRLSRVMSNMSSGASSLVDIGEDSDEEETSEHRNHPAFAAMSEAIRRGSIKVGLTNAQITTENHRAIESDGVADPTAAVHGQQIQGMMGGVDAQIPTEQSEVHAQMAVYVDPGETDGMPSLPAPDVVAPSGTEAGVATSDWAENHAEASALIKAHKTGMFGGFLRNRKSAFRTGLAKGGDAKAAEKGSKILADPEKGSQAAGQNGMSSGGPTPAASGRPSAHRGASGRRDLGTPLSFVSGAGHAIGSKATKVGTNAGHAAQKFGGHFASKGATGSKYGGTFGTGAMAGASVLSSLMALNAAESLPPSGMTTPAGSRPASIMSDVHSSEEERWEKERRRRERKEKEKMRAEQKELERRMHAAAKQAARSAQVARGERPGFLTRPRSRLYDSGSTPGSPVENSPQTGQGMPNAPLSEKYRSKSQNSLPDLGNRVVNSPMKGLKSIADRIGVDLQEFDRPKAARSGGGVFAALAQSTGNLSGAATPAGSTLVPAAKRPGYKLARYSLDGLSRPVSDRGATDPPSRPTSMLVQSDSPMLGEAEGSTKGSPSSGTTKVDPQEALQSPAVAGPNRRAPPSAIEMPPTYHKTGSTGRNGKAFSMKDFKMGPLTPGAASFKQASHWVMGSGTKSQPGTPPYETVGEKTPGGDYFFEKTSRKLTEDDLRRREWEAEKKKRKKAKEKKKQQEIYIIQHVAALLARQQFILKLTRAFMMFGSPSHRLEAQIQATARVLELNCQVVYFPGTALISFGDEATHTSETKFMKQATGLDLGKLLKTHYLYWNVVHDKISAEQASTELDALMLSKPHYNNWTMLLIGGMCSAFICCIAFYGSFIDALISIPLGVLLIAVQILAARNDLYSNIFEIIIATINSFLAAALASTGVFCYTAVASSAIVLILPGYIVLTGALELASRNITAGATRIAYSVIYSLFLGFGLSMGATIYERVTGLQVVGAEDYTCAATHSAGAPWYMVTPSAWWYFLIAPGYSFFLALRQSQPLWAKETPVMVAFSCAGWVTNHFSAQAFPNRSDITSMFGSLVVGVLGNLWGRFFQGTSFIVMLVGILFQLPSGLSNGGLLNFASQNVDGNTNSYGSGFEVAEQLVSVAIGLTVGLFLAAVFVYPFGAGKKRGSGIFSF